MNARNTDMAGTPKASSTPNPTRMARQAASRLPSTCVRRADLATQSQAIGSHFTLLRPDLEADGAALRGSYHLTRMRSGLTLHTSDTYEIHDLTTRVVHGEGLTISLFLEGMADVSMGGRPFLLGPGASGGGAEGSFIAWAEADQFERRGRRGTHARKVNISLPGVWLQQEGLPELEAHRELLAFSRDHLANARWKLSPHLVRLAEQLLAPPDYGPLLRSLYMESRAMEIALEALSGFGRARSSASPADHRRMMRVYDFIEAHMDRELTLEELARDVGMSVSTLQRRFRAVFGVTVFEHVRQRKLELAREALASQGLSVAQAAYLAGYTSSANFATAFKRAFGMSPKAARQR
ncbi:AraC family transcriptional regulator [Azorhizobium oxalatiphilum]|uniref:AraC family transcriptional regulator n=1 Tax=Azorhizobium oxalatiphilum TaxID=980631 RepID=A0A917BLZ9_9HYPH|nr:AraC family transcriptional regulator [Azorhizobium oxalatiphilum]GGF49263.1 AraC family transcriptional regulator [Azorhizobium oxalatiphilum]